MAMAMEMDMDILTDSVPDLLDFSEYSTTTPTSDEDSNNWNHWSPLINWDSFTTGNDDFHTLIDSITDAASRTDVFSSDHDGDEEEHAGDGCISARTATADDGGGGDLKDLRLVHLLMAAAEALAGATKSHDLAQVILIRLKDLVTPTNGTTMERLAAHFTDALESLLECAGCAHSTTIAPKNGGAYVLDDHHQLDMLVAFQLLQDMSPFVKFGHFTANQAIFEAVAHERRAHIVDYDVVEGAQWASLLQALSDGKPGPHLRITALSRGASGRRSLATVQETGRRLTAFAASLGQPFSFHLCRLGPDEIFRPSTLKLVRGEVLIFNCMMHLPHLSYRASDSVVSFFNGAKTLSPKLITLVEEEVEPIGITGFVGRFMESLHHYSAMYDSLEAGFPMQNWARALVERVFLGPRIGGSLARIYREEVERGSWGEWLGAAGFSGVPVSFASHCQARLLVGLFNDGYKVEELGSNKLVLSWKSRPLLSASIWSCSYK